MSNEYYTETWQASVGSLGRSAAHETQYSLIELGFDLVGQRIAALQGITNITGLSGFPASFVNHAGQFLVVNSAETAIEFVSAGKITNKVIGGTSYTILASDAGKRLIFTNASAITLTVPPATLVSGEVILIVQGAAGQVTLAAGAGVTFASSDNLLSTRTQSAQIGIIANGGEAFGVYGERNAPSLGVALLAQANVFTRVQSVTPYRANISGAVSIDLSATAKSNNLHLTLTGNVSSFALTNPSDGAVYNIRFIQDGTGSRTFAGFPAAFKFATGSVLTFSTTAGAWDFVSAEYGATEATYAAAFNKGMV